MASIKQNTGFSNAQAADAEGDLTPVTDETVAETAIAASTLLPDSLTSLQTPSNRLSVRLPDFRNLGICLRIIVIMNLLALFGAIFEADHLSDVPTKFTQVLALLQPIVLLTILLLYVIYPYLLNLSYRWSTAFVLLLSIMATSGVHFIGSLILGVDAMPSLVRAWILAAAMSGLVLYYLNLRQRALTPAIAEARLQALQARIRPHFLFNSINAVLSLIRSQPARAETALEDMADLFRVLMADNRDLVPLADEISLSRQYLSLEKLRLDERLTIVWQIDSMPPDALIPPLVLQPLLENAVYHGIEPMPAGGEITIKIYTHRDEVHLILSNPYSKQTSPHNGNKMALSNIKERLSLHFDAEAVLTSQVLGQNSQAQHYEVHIVIPYKKNLM
jgi:two-component system sensor histidine kinase AlgZ